MIIPGVCAKHTEVQMAKSLQKWTVYLLKMLIQCDSANSYCDQPAKSSIEASPLFIYTICLYNVHCTCSTYKPGYTDYG